MRTVKTQNWSKMRIYGNNSDIHFRMPLEDKRKLQALTRKINEDRKKKNASAVPLTVSDVVRASAMVLINKRLDLMEGNISVLHELKSQLLHVGININQLTHAYHDGFLVQPVDTANLFLDLQSVIFDMLNVIIEIINHSVTFNNDFLAQVQKQIDLIKPAE